jgi:hypothetical protein
MVAASFGCGHSNGSGGGSGSGSGGSGSGGSSSGGSSSGGSSSGSSSGGPVGPPGTLAVWTAGVGTKVQPTTAMGTGTSITVAAPRVAYAAGQLVVNGKGGQVDNVTVTASDLSDGAGHTLAGSNVTFFKEFYIDFTTVKANTGNVPVPKNSPTSDGNIPDPLIPLVDPYGTDNLGQPFSVSQGQNQPVWVDIYVPSGTTAGTYTGNITVTASVGGQATVPLSVTVWNLDLIDMRAVTTHFKMSINALLEYHAGIASCDSSGKNCYLNDNAKCLQIVKRYEELAHQHRIDTGQFFTSGPTSAGECDVPTDWSPFDNSMKPYMDGTYFSDGVPSGRFDVPFSPGSGYGVDACPSAQYTALAAAWASHLKTNGWFDMSVAYAVDEPSSSQFPAIAAGSALMEQGDPDWKYRVMDTTTPDTGNIATLGPAVGIFTVSPPYYDNWELKNGGTDYGRSNWPGLMDGGTQLWFYESNSVFPPYPTFASNTLDGLEPVMMMWGSWNENATGFLYWDIASWTDKDPWGPSIDFGTTGDGVLVYPGNHAGTLAPVGSPSGVAIDGPIPSYRLKMVRQGLQDWALFKMADKANLTSTVQTQIHQVYSRLGGCGGTSGCPVDPDGFYWKDDETKMDAIRAAIAKALGG